MLAWHKVMDGWNKELSLYRAAWHSASDLKWNKEGSHVQGAQDEAQELVLKLDIKQCGAHLDLSEKQLSQKE